MKTKFSLLVFILSIYFLAPDILAQPKLWGTLPFAGDPGAGLVYEFNLDGKQLSDIYAFEKFEGEDPQYELLLADNSLFYGIADGGYGQFGSFIYEYDPTTNAFNIVHDFYDPSLMISYAANDGFLMQASDGLIYGFNQNGGVNSDGQLFSFNPSNRAFEYLVDFEALTTGNRPVGALTEANDGKLYGVTNEGGFCNYGTLFSYDPESKQLVMERCFDWVDGVDPANSLIQASNGILYGMTYAGGGSGDGVIFSYETGTGMYTLLHEFNTSGQGSKPYGRLFQASDGKLYGTASAGGLNGDGILFSYDINLDLFAVEIDFDGTNGAYPNGSLIEYGGLLYGMTTEGGVANEGILFKYDNVSNTITKLADCYGVDYGRYPYGTLTIGPDGNLFGQTYRGGKNDDGIMFEYSPSSFTFTKRFDFGQADDGAYNYGSLKLGSDGWVYGTTAEGGQYGYGTIYRINPVNREFESLFDFDMFGNGGTPLSGLMQATDGYYYGATTYGGTVNGGMLYRFNASNNILTVLEDLSPSTGTEPSGTPMQASNGFLYGLTKHGGSIGDGALYKFNLSTSVYAKQADFQDAATGSLPLGSLVEATNGKLYAMAEYGGQFTYGTLFEYDPANASLFVMVHFDGLNKGSYPAGTLLEYDDNKLYGMCTSGGVYDAGTLFVFDAISGVCTKVHDFNPANDGYKPYSTLMRASNNKIYGTTTRGGAYDSGVLFQYDPGTGEYMIMHEFTSFREYPWFSAFIEVDTDFGINESDDQKLYFNVFPNPANDQIKISCDHTADDIRLSILDVRGRMILEKNYSQTASRRFSTTFAIESLESGIYFVRLSSGGNIRTQKIVVR